MNVLSQFTQSTLSNNTVMTDINNNNNNPTRPLSALSSTSVPSILNTIMQSSTGSSDSIVLHHLIPPSPTLTASINQQLARLQAQAQAFVPLDFHTNHTITHSSNINNNTTALSSPPQSIRDILAPQTAIAQTPSSVNNRQLTIPSMHHSLPFSPPLLTPSRPVSPTGTVISQAPIPSVRFSLTPSIEPLPSVPLAPAAIKLTTDKKNVCRMVARVNQYAKKRCDRGARHCHWCGTDGLKREKKQQRAQSAAEMMASISNRHNNTNNSNTNNTNTNTSTNTNNSNGIQENKSIQGDSDEDEDSEPLSLFCRNVYCRKYMCAQCHVKQKMYFGNLFPLVFGDVTSPNWYCLICVLWKDPKPVQVGICCCRWRTLNEIECVLHPNRTDMCCHPARQKKSETLIKRTSRMSFPIERFRISPTDTNSRILYWDDHFQVPTTRRGVEAALALLPDDNDPIPGPTEPLPPLVVPYSPLSPTTQHQISTITQQLTDTQANNNNNNHTNHSNNNNTNNNNITNANTNPIHSIPLTTVNNDSILTSIQHIGSNSTAHTPQTLQLKQQLDNIHAINQLFNKHNNTNNNHNTIHNHMNTNNTSHNNSNVHSNNNNVINPFSLTNGISSNSVTVHTPLPTIETPTLDNTHDHNNNNNNNNSNNNSTNNNINNSNNNNNINNTNNHTNNNNNNNTHPAPSDILFSPMPTAVLSPVRTNNTNNTHNTNNTITHNVDTPVADKDILYSQWLLQMRGEFMQSVNNNNNGTNNDYNNNNNNSGKPPRKQKNKTNPAKQTNGVRGPAKRAKVK